MASCAVITRTKSRPLLLRRAMSSVAAQTFRDFQWLVVNDAGDPGPVESIVSEAKGSGVNVAVLHRQASTGMEAASNAGVRASQSDFIVIHDDDDTWEPRFLERTVAYLNANPLAVGVSTHCTRVTERIDGSNVRKIKSEPHLPVLSCVQLADMFRSNLFPPITLLYRRQLFDQLGGYDESMLVLGDWDFNIRALLVGDIDILPEVLANYHVRESKKPPGADYLNSVTPGSMTQAIADARYRNRWLRHDIAAGKPGLGFLLAMGRLGKQRGAMANLVSGLKQWF